MLADSLTLNMVVLTALAMMISTAATCDASKYPNWSGQRWRPKGRGFQWDQTKPSERGQDPPRTYQGSGIPLRADNQSIKECIFLDKTDRDILHNEITVEDHALTPPWTVDKRYHRIHDLLWYEDNRTEDNHYVIVGKEDYFVSGDGYLRASRKGRAPADLR